jgi:hypothetical protein
MRRAAAGATSAWISKASSATTWNNSCPGATRSPIEIARCTTTPAMGEAITSD